MTIGPYSPACSWNSEWLWYQYVPDCFRVKRYSQVSPGAMPSKLMPGTPSMLAGSRMPCQWIELGASARRLLTRTATVSPSRQRSSGAGTLPLTATAGLGPPVIARIVGPMERSKSRPARSGEVMASAGVRSRPVPAAPARARPWTKRRRAGDDGGMAEGSREAGMFIDPVRAHWAHAEEARRRWRSRGCDLRGSGDGRPSRWRRHVSRVSVRGSRYRHGVGETGRGGRHRCRRGHRGRAGAGEVAGVRVATAVVVAAIRRSPVRILLQGHGH